MKCLLAPERVDTHSLEKLGLAIRETYRKMVLLAERLKFCDCIIFEAIQCPLEQMLSYAMRIIALIHYLR